MVKSKRNSSGKFQRLDPEDIEKDQILITGRHPCTCEASKHQLISNCLSCGRIVCVQEGSGPCFTCGQLVCTPAEQELICQESKKGIRLYAKLMNLKDDPRNVPSKPTEDGKLQNALDHGNKLLEYDRTVEKRTKVIDDENDFFQIDSKWISEEKRKMLKEKKEEMDDKMFNRRNQKFSLDFAGRRIVEEAPKADFDVTELLKEDNSIFECKDISVSDIPMNMRPVYEEESGPPDYVSPPEKAESKRLLIRIQDKELQEMSDEGHCLTLHQPYASLLVAGIKKHEGRVWYTSYRGRLWIHSASKEPSPQDINEVENLYRNIRVNCSFPKKYPTSCLIGCVDLVDCLPQEEYTVQFPHGEIASTYAFICENPQELRIPIPMKGKHKIYKLENRIHQVAKKTLSKLS